MRMHVHIFPTFGDPGRCMQWMQRFLLGIKSTHVQACKFCLTYLTYVQINMKTESHVLPCALPMCASVTADSMCTK